ncbi:MAG: type III-B CRISPR module-associated Cmr3 family protein, partial [Cyanobacteriota bacterium]
APQPARGRRGDRHTAGPFGCSASDGLMLPAPLPHLHEREGRQRLSRRRLSWQISDDERQPSGWRPADGADPPRKAPTGGWVSLDDWARLGQDELVMLHEDPWQAVPHLHPRLREEERVSAGEGALFLEYGIALEPGVRLAYLSSHDVPSGVYRFGGEGHLVQLSCRALPPVLTGLLQEPLVGTFALITAGLWGGPKLSLREPIDTSVPNGRHPWHRDGMAPAILTDKPRPWRHRLGEGANNGRRRLSRGRWAVPAGSCYRVPGRPLPPWIEWEEAWFPKEGFSFQQLGTALALPLHGPP